MTFSHDTRIRKKNFRENVLRSVSTLGRVETKRILNITDATIYQIQGWKLAERELRISAQILGR